MRDIDAAYVRFAEVVSETAANEWRDGLIDALSELARFPRRCPLAPEPFQREVRQHLYRRPYSRVAYRILFTIIGDQDESSDPPTVIILHLRHASARPVTAAQAREIESQR
jgi:plasmid stabilization system protein ParE